MPFHRGHQYLIDFARQHCDELTVLVCSIEAEPIDGALRYQWVKEYCRPDVRVLHVQEEVPQEPAEHPRFWAIWKELVLRYVGAPIDRVYASEAYGKRLAEEVGAQFVPVDLARELVSISGSAIRAEPMEHWDYLVDSVRPFFAKRISIFGPESTGKTTLTFKLARHFQTVAVHEYARSFLETFQRPCEVEDMIPIVKGQIAAEEAMARQANRLLFCDTDPLATTIWSDALFGHSDPWIEMASADRKYDLTLLLDVDVPWVADEQRYFPTERESFFARCEAMLERHGRPYVVIRGTFEERFERAVEAIDSLF